MKTKAYAFLVNRHSGISYRYHKMHDGADGFAKLLSWLYLLWLNFAYYLLFCRFLGKKPEAEFYESKRILTQTSESGEHLSRNPELSVSSYVNKLKEYDVVSFDLFDTLIFRPVSQPADVFYLIEEKLGIPNFKSIREEAEQAARIMRSQKYGDTEVTLEEIWDMLSKKVGCSGEHGMALEQSIELALCRANPFMLEVWRQLIRLNKKLIVISDMYLSSGFLTKILSNAGFHGSVEIYVSCEYRKNKALGSLFRLVKKDLGDVSVIHVGDNPQSDRDMAEKNGFDTILYMNVNRCADKYRPFDMSYLVGSAYRGIVNSHLYNGMKAYSMEYEYGYLYGGIFVFGYCNFIHEYAVKNNADRILFLSRDGDILKQVYDFLFPDENTAYVYWSRKAAVKLMADKDKSDYFRRFIFHKVNQGLTIRNILSSMELDFLTEQLEDWKEIWQQRESEEENGGRRFADLKPEDELTDKNGYPLQCFIEAKWNQVIGKYLSQRKAARSYYSDVLNGCGRALAVDIGWAGSGALALSYLCENVWRIPCEITGILAGTNTIHNAEPDASEPFLQSGKLAAYLYSQRHNRDLLKKHDPNKDYNIFWELLLSSPTRQFTGFDLKEDGTAALSFGEYDSNLPGMIEIQQGILDFAHQYYEHFKAFPYMFRISGRDAYAPMLLAASCKESYLKTIEGMFDPEVNV